MNRREPGSNGGDAPLVLLIDDDAAFLSEVERLLREQGYDVALAHDAFEALALSKEIYPVAVLLDVILPDIEGPQLCRLLRQSPGFETIPIIFTTGREKANVLRECLLAGGNDFIRKSHLELELPLRLESHLRIKRENDRLLNRNRELNTLLYFARLLNRSLSLPSVLQSMVEELSMITGADRASVILWNENTGKLLATAETGFTDVELELGKYPEVAQALETRQTVYIPDVASDENLRDSEHLDDLVRRGITSLLVVPMQTGGNLLGTLFLRSTAPQTIPADTVAFCQAAAEIACRAVLNAQLFEHVRAERDRLLFDQGRQDGPEGERPARRTHEITERVLDLLRGLHLNITAEALGTVNLIGGYTELILEPRDVERLDSRQVRGMRMVQQKTRLLERLIRMYQYLPLPRETRPASAAAIVDQARLELMPIAREHDLKLSVETVADWNVPDGEHFRVFFLGLLRHYIVELAAHSELKLTIDAGEVSLSFAATDGDSEFPAELWHDMAAIHGLDLRYDRPPQGGRQLCVRIGARGGATAAAPDATDR